MINPIPSIPQVFRNVRRWTEILAVLSKYGLADGFSRLNIEFIKDRLKSPDGESLARLSQEARIRMTLSELGPTFIKLGQLLSTRPDIVGPKLAEELTKLQSNAPADDYDYVRKTIEDELGQRLEEVFASFNPTPVASASIGQVHRAKLIDGREVVVKVRHQGIESTVNNDLEILAGMAQLAEMLEDWKAYRPIAVVAEFARMMRRELEFGREERNLQQFAAMFEADVNIRVPKPVGEYCTSQVITMEYIEGIPVSQPELLQTSGYDLNALASRLAEAYLRMIFQEGFFHADPHPGNILILRGHTIALLDFGMVSRISERMRDDIEEMLLAIINTDVALVATILRRVATVPDTIDERGFAVDIADYVGQYAGVSLDRFNLSQALTEMMALIRKHRILLPSEVAILLKVLITLEGTGRLLSPSLSVMELMRPFRRQLLLRRLSPIRQAKKVRRILMQLERMAEDFPQRFSSILEQIQLGKFDVHVDHRRLGPSVNRLVLGMITSAVFLGASWMLSSRVPPLIHISAWGIEELSVTGLLALLASMTLGARLAWAIGNSGNLDRPN